MSAKHNALHSKVRANVVEGENNIGVKTTNARVQNSSNYYNREGNLMTGRRNFSSSGRPVSAGHIRPSQSSNFQASNMHGAHNNRGHNANTMNSTNITSGESTSYMKTHKGPSVLPIQLPFPSRPKSAGVSRNSDQYRNDSNQYQFHSRVMNSGVNAMFTNSGGTIGTLMGNKNVKLSGNQFNTSNINLNSSGFNNTFADHWSTSYKLHYGYGIVADPRSADVNMGINRGNLTSAEKNHYSTGKKSNENGKVRAHSSSAMNNRLRSAIHQGQKINDVNGCPRETYNIGTDYSQDMILEHDEADDVEGRKVYGSRSSNPEVSLTTPPNSVDMIDSINEIDNRNSSLRTDSLESQHIGLTTVPNRFCSIVEAMDLKKILTLSKGSRGGIVLSSTAVMDMYMVGKVIGIGSYGKVRAAWHRLTGGKVAIKTYDKSKLTDPAHWKRVHSEIKIMEQISHPRIARMFEAIETPKRMHLIMECLDGGNLCTFVKAKKRLSEDESKRIFFQIVQATEYLHSYGISHRDVKLENVLFDGDKNIKLIDFGFSTVCQHGKRLKVFCGTPSYMAPEIVRRTEYEGKPVDIWSLGILLYALLCGCFPFRAKSYPDLYRRISRGTFSIPEEFSPPVKDILRQLLEVDVSQRVTAPMILRHPWLQSQLTTSPDMSKLRLDTAILISDKPDDDMDDITIDELIRFGINKDEIIRQVMTKTHSALTTLYYLLLDFMIEARRLKNAKVHGNRVISAGSKHHRNDLSNTTAISESSGHQVTNMDVIIPTVQSETPNKGSNTTFNFRKNNVAPLYMQNTRSAQNRNNITTSGANTYDGGMIRPRSASTARVSTGHTMSRPSSAYVSRNKANVI